MIIELTIILSTATATVEASNDIDVTIILNDEVVNPQESFCERVDTCLDIPTQNGNYVLKILNGVKSWVTAVSGVSWGSITGTLSNQTDLQNALNAKENSIPSGTTSQYFRGDKTFQTLDKNAVGLGNVDNTSDANKPISSATQSALDNKVDKVTGKGLSTNDLTDLLKAAYDSAVTWITTNGNNILNHLSNTSNPHSTTATQVDALKRDGSNANSDIDVSSYSINLKSLGVKGTNGNGHIGLKHQASNASANVNETSFFAGSDGELYYKNDGNAVVQIASRTWVAAQGFITNVISALGYTPVPETRTITINGTAQDLSANRSWTVSVDQLTDLRTKGFHFDDFDIVGTISSPAFIHNTFYVSYGGSWQATSWATTGLNMWGVVQVNTFNSTASIGFGSNAFQYQTILGGATFETRVRFEDLSTATDRFTYYSGFLNNATFNGNNRIRFNYSDNINSGKFQIECNNGGASSTADSGVTVAADTWYVLKFVINSAANSVEFFINGVSVGTITTNIPSNGVYPFTQINRSTYVNTRQIYVDYHFAQTTINR